MQILEEGGSFTLRAIMPVKVTIAKRRSSAHHLSGVDVRPTLASCTLGSALVERRCDLHTSLVLTQEQGICLH